MVIDTTKSSAPASKALSTVAAFGRTSDAAEFERTVAALIGHWQRTGDLLGATAGVTDAGEAVVVLTAVEGGANGAVDDVLRSLHGGQLLRATDVRVYDGPSADAGFVQVIAGRSRDPRRTDEIEAEVLPAIHASREEILGSVRIWAGERLVELAYFTSEAAARAGERQPLEPRHLVAFGEWQGLLHDLRHLDLARPLLHGAQHHGGARS